MPQPLTQFRAASPLKIGLLGGSFNPAHAGHVHISLEALKLLNLDMVWWLVSPANPLKERSTLAPFEARFDYAQHYVKDPRIVVSDYEEHYDLQYTIDTLTHITTNFAQHHFVWLMGGDNLAGFHRWEGWQNIAQMLPIAVLDRAPFALSALHAPMAQRFIRQRYNYRTLATRSAPAWDYVPIRRHSESATRLRALHQSDTSKNAWQKRFFQA